MGYPASIFRGIISTHYITILCITFMLLSPVTVIQLCVSRYLIINGHEKFPWKHGILMAFFYAGAGTLIVQMGRSHADEKEIIERYSQVSYNYVSNHLCFQQYSCVTPGLFNISGFIIYDNEILLGNTMILMVFFIPAGMFAGIYFLVMSYRAIHVAHMSAQLARLQRKLILTLILQIMIPILIVGIPTSVFQAILFFKIMNAGTGELTIGINNVIQFVVIS